mmetsp:Transcript_14454/g.41568  ORF Transcript_14454/g.41568 Transcript_14454/m.41568 type:complete len:89 (-) Transcript_14454:86-352(-)
MIQNRSSRMWLDRRQHNLDIRMWALPKAEKKAWPMGTAKGWGWAGTTAEKKQSMSEHCLVMRMENSKDYETVLRSVPATWSGWPRARN